MTGSPAGFSTFLNIGHGSFAAATTYPVPYLQPPDSTSVVIADLNGDGRPDVILGDISKSVDSFSSSGPFVFFNTR